MIKVNRKNDDDDDEYKPFDVEKANVYQLGATFVYVLYGQMKEVDENGDECWKSLPFKGKGAWKKLNWSPKILDLRWLAKSVDKQPNKRPNYDDLLRYIFELILIFILLYNKKNKTINII